MNETLYVITGATGRTGSTVANALLDHGRKVRVLGRDVGRLEPFAARGAEPFVVDPLDTSALSRAFRGAQAAYIMLQPNYIHDHPDFRSFQDKVIESLGLALQDSGVRHAVSLSSWGADKPSGVGPVTGLHLLEKRLERITDLNVLHLRAGYFMENTFSFVGSVLSRDVAASPFHPDVPMPMIATGDIGAAAATELLELDFQGHQVRELQGQRDLTMRAATAIIGEAIGRPDLAYVQDGEDHFCADLRAVGCSESIIGLMVEVVHAINSGHARATQPRSKRTTTPTTYESFVQEQWLPKYLEAKS